MSKQPHQIVFAVVNAPKIARKSGAKSRNGCLTCKARHIKCSEEKPVCRRCTSSGKRCSGYALSVHDRTPSSRSNSPSSSWNDLSLTVDTALGLPQTPIDRRYLEHFRNRSVPALSRIGDCELWGDLVLRLSASRPTIQFAVLALSAQHEAYIDDGIGAFTGRSTAATYALHQYSKGIAALNHSLATTTPDFDLMEIIVACMLFASFELLQGNGNDAMRHCKGGLQILSSKFDKQRTEKADDCEELVSILNSKPVRFLIRLDVDNITYGAYPLAFLASSPLLSTREPHGITCWSPKPDSNPFENIVAAREDLYSHLAWNYSFERNVAYPLQEYQYNFGNSPNSWESSDCTSIQNSGNSQVPDHILQWQEVLLTNMRNWNSGLQALVQPLLAVPSEDRTIWPRGSEWKNKFLREFASIHIACISSYMSLYTCLAAEEDAQALYDSLLEEFRSLIRSAEIIVLDSSEMMQGEWEWAILGRVIQPLAFTALKCRDHTLRNRAISLLSRSGRGSWDGQNLAKVVRCIVDYEESQAHEEKGTGNLLGVNQNDQGLWEEVHERNLEVPVCARVCRTELELDMSKKKVCIWMKCARDEAGTTCEVDLNNESEWEERSIA